MCHYCGKNLTACHPKSKKFTKYYCRNKTCEVYAKSIDGAYLTQDFWELLKAIKPSKSTESLVKNKIIKKYEERQSEFKTEYLEKEDQILHEKSLVDGIYKKEVNIDSLLTYAFAFIRTIENTWADAEFEPKIKLQQFIFNKKIAYDVVNREFSL